MQAAGRGRSPFRLRRNTRAKPVSPAYGGRGCAPSPRPAETLPYIQYSSHIFLPAARQNTFGNRLFTPPQSETQCWTAIRRSATCGAGKPPAANMPPAGRAIKSKGPPSLPQVGRTASFLFFRLGGSLAGRGTRAQPVSAPPKHTGKARVARLRRAGLRPIPTACGNSSLYTIQQPHFPACRPTKYLRQSPFYTPAK